jgi:anti-anti-sigma factor
MHASDESALGGELPLGPQMLEVQDVITDGRHTLRVSGELDMGSAPELEAIVVRLCELGSSHLTLDLSNVTFIDSTGLQAVIDARNRCAQHKQEFRITPGPPSVQRIFEITGLLESLPFESDAAPAT